MTGIFRVTGYASHSQAHDRVQWVANPLSVHIYFVLASRVYQVRDSALHRIELRTSRLYNPTLSTTILSGRCVFTSNQSKYSKELTNRASHRLQQVRPTPTHLQCSLNATGCKFEIIFEIVHKTKFTFICEMLCCPLS